MNVKFNFTLTYTHKICVTQQQSYTKAYIQQIWLISYASIQCQQDQRLG